MPEQFCNEFEYLILLTIPEGLLVQCVCSLQFILSHRRVWLSRNAACNSGLTVLHDKKLNVHTCTLDCDLGLLIQ